MLRKLILPMLFILIGAVSSQAQIGVGLRAGISLFNVNTNDTLFNDAKSNLAIHVAVPIEIPVSDIFSVQPELNFTQKGYKFEEGDIKLKLVSNYIALPILAKFNFGSESMGINVFVGPEFGYWLSGKATIDIAGMETTTDYKFTDSGDVQDQRLDIGAVAGVGLSIPAGPGSFIADARYSLDFNDGVKFENADIKPDNYDPTTNGGIIISVGYMIKIGG